jgi:hypothetical protein
MPYYFKFLSPIILLCYLPLALAINDTQYLDSPEHQFWFAVDDLPEIELVFEEAQWQLLLTSSSNERQEVSGSFVFIKNNERYQLDNIGIKVSGNTSFVLPEKGIGEYVQANFTLDFDEFVDDQELSGISALKLKRFHNDPSYVREPLSNQIMQNFNIWTAHSSTYAQVNIKIGDRDRIYFGVYRLNESVNRHEYLDKRFGKDNDGGFLWQGNYKTWGKAHFSRISEQWQGVGDFDEASFEYKGKGKKYEEGHAQLVEFANNITELQGDEFEAYVDKHINTDLLLKGLAAEAILGHWDGFWGNGNNYFVYFDEAEVMHFIPYDTDNTLGTSIIVEDSGTQDPIVFASAENTPLLVAKVLAIDKHLQVYKAHLLSLVTQTDLMVERYAVPWIEKVHALITDAIDNDTGDNVSIVDQPANWGNQPDYRIFDVGQGNANDRNWYQTRLNAVNKKLGLSESVFTKVYYRGDSNQWQSTLMTEREVNIWTITLNNNVDSGSGFKFDIFDDWQENYGDDDNDGVLERSGSNILFNQGQGKYLITLNALEKSYVVEKLDGFPLNDDESGDKILLSETEVDNNETVNVNNNENVEPIPPVLLAPIANAGLDVEAYIDETVHFDASLSTDTDGEIIHYQWSNGLEGVSFSTLFSKVGTYQIALTVTDNDQQVASDSRTIVVKNRESDNSEADNNQTSTDASNDNILDTDTTNNNVEINTDNKKSGGAISGLFCLVIVQFLAWRQKKNIKYYLQKPNK